MTTSSRLPRLRRLLDHSTTLTQRGRGSRRCCPPGAMRLLALAASLLVLNGCATSQRQPYTGSLPLATPVADLTEAKTQGTLAYVDTPVQADTLASVDAAVRPTDVTPGGAPGNAAQPVAPQIVTSPIGSTLIEIIGNTEVTGPAVGQPIDPLDTQAAPITLGSEQSRSDLWGRIRGGFAMPDLGGMLVRDHERWYASRPDYVQRMTDRGSRYLFHIVQEVHKRGMPTELALLPFIESAFNPQAQSVAKASGMWQFIPSTGRSFDLKQNVFRDDRRDVLASTRAALDYLERLHEMFDGDWQLALAAYNWGEGNVRKAVSRNQRLGRASNYENLSMPVETRNYLPKLQAVKNIVMNPQAYGLDLPALENHPYFVSVPLRRDIDAALAARLAGLSLEEFVELNPSQNKPVILAAGTPQVLLPYDNASQFVEQLAAYQGPLASWTAWVVPQTMKPADAARRVGMNEATLRDVNRIPQHMLLRAGSTLLVPRGELRSEDVSEHLADNAQIMLAPDGPTLRRQTVKAGRGDSIASVAQRYRLNVAQVAKWNRASPGTRLAAGQTVVLYLAAPNVKSRPVVKVASKRATSGTRRAITRITTRRTASIAP